MIGRALDFLADYPPFVAAGWCVLVVAWHTSVLAAMFAAWRSWRVYAPAQRQHRAAALAFSACLGLALVTPVVLFALPSSQTVFSSGPLLDEVLTTHRPDGFSTGIPSILKLRSGVVDAAPVDRIAAFLGVLWLAGVCVLAVRLFGGWLTASRIRRRSSPVTEQPSRDLVERLREELRLPHEIALRQSDDVEAPVVMGWLRPTIIIPTDIRDHLLPDMFAAVIRHELAHVRRGDYGANVAQSIVEVILWFSPGVLWLSGVIRETREFCCDDVAVDRCDPHEYVAALTRLAGLGALNTVKSGMGAAGPRLIVRLRRVLRREVSRPSPLRLAASLAAVVALGLGSGPLLGSSAAGFDRATKSSPPSQDGMVPYGWMTRQEGSGVILSDLVSTLHAPLRTVRVENVSSETIVELRFAVVIEKRPQTQRQLLVLHSGPVHTQLAPGEAVDLPPGIPSASELQNIIADARGERVQMFLGLTSVRYADGGQWSVAVNRYATDGLRVFQVNTPGNMDARPEIPRDWIDRQLDGLQQAASLCQDERGRAYSAGAIVPIRREPGRLARCERGRWVEHFR